MVPGTSASPVFCSLCLSQVPRSLVLLSLNLIRITILSQTQRRAVETALHTSLQPVLLILSPTLTSTSRRARGCQLSSLLEILAYKLSWFPTFCTIGLGSNFLSIFWVCVVNYPLSGCIAGFQFYCCSLLSNFPY